MEVHCVCTMLCASVCVCMMCGECACIFLGGGGTRKIFRYVVSVCAFVYAYMQVQMCVYCVTVGCARAFTCDFSESGVLAARMHDCSTVFLTHPAKISHRFHDRDVWCQLSPQ